MTDNGSTTREEDVPPLSDAVTQDEDVAQGGHASASAPSSHDGASDAADNSSKSRGRSKLGWMLGVVGIAALLTMLAMIAVSALGGIAWRQAVSIVMYAGLAGLIAVVLLLAFIFRRRKTGKSAFELPVIAGLAGGAVAAVYAASWGLAWIGHPAIHDISTELADPPQFRSLTVRPDNFDDIPGAGDSDMTGLNPRQRWAAVHQDAYPDIRSVRIDAQPAAVLAKAQRLAEDRGWTIAPGDSDTTLEAQGRDTLLGVDFIFILRALPAQDGRASLIDVRMVTREGRSDYGVLAPIVRTFLADLSGTTTALQEGTTPAR
ncbi:MULTISPECIES: DUF1499 domain-containing protein [Citromicrobium]|uniref:DUF1499 domain-containing protein n=1 Tax=Citromicrobium TaxID=72173 RepID=UPI00031DFB77|nr:MULTISPECIES: DUF1499 domain-containing protein [Citromicrobium]